MEPKETWLFVDHENIGNMDSLDTETFQKIIVFVGATHKTLKIRFVQLHQNISMEVIKIRNVGQNNLDFHLAYILGKLDATTNSDIEFVVLSADKGFDHLIRFIHENGRACRRESLSSLKRRPELMDQDEAEEIDDSQDAEAPVPKRTIHQKKSKDPSARNNDSHGIPLSNDIQAKVSDTISKLKKIAGNKRPRKARTLKNYIKTFHKEFEDVIYDQLLSLKCIEENKSSISYSMDISAIPIAGKQISDEHIQEIANKLEHLSGNQRPRKQKTLLNYLKNLKKGKADEILKQLINKNIVNVSEDGKTQYNL